MCIHCIADETCRFDQDAKRVMGTCDSSIMKSMLKSELAAAAGVSRDTFRRWLQSDKDYLRSLGLKPKAKMLPPRVVNYLIDKYCIDL